MRILALSLSIFFNAFLLCAEEVEVEIWTDSEHSEIIVTDASTSIAELKQILLWKNLFPSASTNIYLYTKEFSRVLLQNNVPGSWLGTHMNESHNGRWTVVIEKVTYNLFDEQFIGIILKKHPHGKLALYLTNQLQ